MLQIRLRPRAVADLDAIWAHTAERWGTAQATAYLTGLDAAFTLLAEFPEIARLREAFTPPLRIHPCREHLVIYRAETDHLDILRVVHGRANWSEFLAE